MARFFIGDHPADLPPGDGHGVIVYPGFMASDASTHAIRTGLAQLGYQVRGWQQGRNYGLKRDLLSEMRSHLVAVAEETGGPISLFGWSLGGLYARELAKRRPDLVRGVITAGTPCQGDLHATNAWRLYEFMNDHKVDDPPVTTDLAELPPVPVTSIICAEDGIVARECADIGHGDRHETVRVASSHIGLVWSPEVLAITADRLAQTRGEWRPWAPRQDKVD